MPPISNKYRKPSFLIPSWIREQVTVYEKRNGVIVSKKTVSAETYKGVAVHSHLVIDSVCTPLGCTHTLSTTLSGTRICCFRSEQDAKAMGKYLADKYSQIVKAETLEQMKELVPEWMKNRWMKLCLQSGTFINPVDYEE